MFSFAHPYFFLLALPLAVAAWALFGRRIRQALLFAPLARLPPARPTWRAAAALVLPFLFLAGLALLIVALARPQTVLSTTTQRANAIAIQMVVDVSGSMEALDLSPSQDRFRTRLEVVKETFAKFIERRQDDLIGLVTFGGFATSRVPLTIDHGVLLHTLKGVQIPRPTLNRNGQVDNNEEILTAIGDALATACGRLDQAELKSKIIVLLTDGESNTGLIKPEDAAKAAKALGIKVYTIGVGSNGRAPFLRRDMFGNNLIGYAEVRLDEDLLKAIASATGGQYFNVRDPKGLDRAMAEIDKLEKTKIRKEVYNQYNELFLRPLLAGLLLCTLAAGANMLVARKLL
jgi:Ca-activated chloride channel family protein